MRSIARGGENPTELRLDYKDISAGQLVIVINGFPTTVADPFTSSAGGPRSASGSGPNGNRRHGSPPPLIEEAEAIHKATGYAPALFTPLLRAAWRGQEDLALELIAATIEEASAEDAGRITVLTEYAKAVLYNGLGRYEDAAVAAQRACAPDDLGFFGWARLELVEAGARSDARAVATEALRDLDERTQADDNEWALGVRARSAALLSDGAAAEALYRDAIERFDRGRIAVQLARAQLVYGEWLRRENRRMAAREQLRAAHETCTRIAADAFAARARRELLATGETARRRTDDTRDILTPQEAQIARLARDGLSNPEIGAQLFISPRTVQYHLRKVFLKLDITSRNQLGRIPPSRLGVA
jgi:DNA-binding CsgD family transcriptional regulator